MRTQLFVLMFLCVSLFSSQAQAGLGIVEVVEADAWSEVSIKDITITVETEGTITITDGRQVMTLINRASGCEFYDMPEFKEDFHSLKVMICRKAGLVDLTLNGTYLIDGRPVLVEEIVVDIQERWRLNRSQIVAKMANPLDLLDSLENLQFVDNGRFFVARIPGRNVSFILDANCDKRGPWCDGMVYTLPPYRGYTIKVFQGSHDGSGVKYYKASAHDRTHSGVSNEDMCNGEVNRKLDRQSFKFCPDESILRMTKSGR